MCLSIFSTLCGDSRLYIGITREFADTLGPVIHPRILVKISGGIIIYRDFKQTDRQTKGKVEARSVRPGIVMRYVCMPWGGGSHHVLAVSYPVLGGLVGSLGSPSVTARVACFTLSSFAPWETCPGQTG